MKNFLNMSALLMGTMICVSPVLAEVLTFGGDAEQFKGDGDLVPPECKLDLPLVASSAFFVKWDCSDNNSPKDDLRSELWIKPKGENIARKVKDFLGFPASVEVNEGLLKSLTETADTTEDASTVKFEDYLPAEFRLIVRDRGGAAAISEVKFVLPGSALSCELTLKTASVEASGDSTGVPSLEALASSVDGANSGGGLQSLSEFTFSTCEIEEICKDDSPYSFSVSEAGAFALIGTETSFTGTGELTIVENEPSTYTGVLASSESGELSVELTCK